MGKIVVEALLEIFKFNNNGYMFVLWVNVLSTIVQNWGNHLKKYVCYFLRNWLIVTNLVKKNNWSIFEYIGPFECSGTKQAINLQYEIQNIRMVCTHN